MPTTWGVIRARILLPEDAILWPRARLRSVVVHEIAHIKRWDFFTQFVAEITCAIYWFNPLAWHGARRMRVERERACDDAVLNNGTRGSDYAEDLLTLSTSQNLATAGGMCIGVISNGELERRLRQILDPAHRRLLGWRSAAVFIAAALAATCAIAAVYTSQPPAAGDIVRRWAEARGWTSAHVTEATLETPSGWRNIPFDIPKEEEADVRQSVRLARGQNDYENNVAAFTTTRTRDDLAALVQHRPKLFYAKFLLAQWYEQHGDAKRASELFSVATADAPTILVQRFQRSDGSPLAGVEIQSFSVECNRVQHGYLDPSLDLEFHNLQTDSDGCLYIPAYSTVYRIQTISYPDGYEMQVASLGWFECPAKVGELPPAISTEKAGDFTPAVPPSLPPVAAGKLPDGNTVELLAIARHSDLQKRWWRPDGSSLSATYDTSLFGEVDRRGPFGRWIILRFARAFPANAHVQLQFSKPTSGANYYSEVRNVNEPFPVYVGFPTDPQKIDLRVGEASGDWKNVAEYVLKSSKTSQLSDTLFEFKIERLSDGKDQISVIHGPIHPEIRLQGVDDAGQVHDTTVGWFGREESSNPPKVVITDTYHFPSSVMQKIVKLQLQSRDFVWTELDNIANRPAS